MFKKIALVLAGIIIGSVSIAAAASAPFRVVQTPAEHLYTGIAGSATTMRITPYPKDLDGNKLTMNDLGTTTYMTIDPKISGSEEIVSATGITDNGDNTATLTGLSRDLTSKYPYTTTGTGRTHGGGATVVFSNNPQVYGSLGALLNDQTWSGINTFTLSPIVPTPSSATQAANKSYVDGVALVSAPNADTATKGVVQEATAAQAASSTATGSTAARLYIPAAIATSSNDVAGLHSVMTQNSGKINWNQIDLGTAFTVTGLATFSNATTTVTNNLNVATTTPTWGFGLNVGTSALFGGGVSVGSASSTIGAGTMVVGNLASTTNLIVSNKCTNCADNGFATSTSSGAGPTTLGNSGVTATCAAGKHIIGGGGSDSQTDGEISMYNSFPATATTWEADFSCNQGGGCAANTMTAYAICVNP